ncbi:hypothetical protein NP493_521g00011 [Ridgeia piscesae]|uniref:Pre-mRNA splicing factor n=1 Tax=Ridgeia piscesae TaxID=27915 RepID=A0AAD9NSD3_RIDPI|nr:hypothetical protein NP493_521g00011 [Ridgeia piscesae]
MDKLLKKMDSLDPEERKRLRTLLEEKSDKKTEVQWMYKCDKPGSEEYLLGRRIDKHIEEPKESEETDKDAPGALFEEVIARRTDLDMHTKMREDPLYAIRRQEEEARKKLLQNPIKMKHLQKLIEEKEQHRASKKRKEKKKKHKKHKKHKHRSSSSSSDSDDSLVRQYLEVVKKKQEMGAGVGGSSRSEDEQEEVRKRQYGLIVAATQEAVPKKQRQESLPSRRRETESESTREERRKRHGREASRTSSPHNKSRSYQRSRSRERQGSRHRHSEPNREQRKSRKLDSEAMDRKRQAMLDNAKWRDEQRRENIKKYKEDADKEKTVSTKHKHGAEFLNPLLMEHAAQSSIADRIKRNIYSIQRTPADLDKNFTKH